MFINGRKLLYLSGNSLINSAIKIKENIAFKF